MTACSLETPISQERVTGQKSGDGRKNVSCSGSDSQSDNRKHTTAWPGTLQTQRDSHVGAISMERLL
jgi:hypothetical protein